MTASGPRSSGRGAGSLGANYSGIAYASSVGKSSEDKSGGGSVPTWLISGLQAPLPVNEIATGRILPTVGRQRTQPSLLNKPQQAIQIGDTIPLVFCRQREDGTGGVLIYPRATECAFSNNSTTVTARHHVVLSQGQIGSIQKRDFRIGNCRRGDFSQNYNQRAGTWTPGNTITPQAGYEAPTASQACGGGGDYKDISTLEFSNTVTGGSDDWSLGCNIFIRNGLIIQGGRLLDGIVGSSDNIADLVLFGLKNCRRPLLDDQIDFPSLELAARFTELYGMRVNAEFDSGEDFSGFLLKILPYFLLRATAKNGKFSLRPLVPVKDDGSINVDTIQNPDWVLTEQHIINPVSSNYTTKYIESSKQETPPIIVQWRQQTTQDIPIKRTYTIDNGINPGPAESHDLYQFCPSERHAAMVAAYLYYTKSLTTHTAALNLRPGGQTGRMTEGQIVQVRLLRDNGIETPDILSQFYTIDAIGSTSDGGEALQLSHWPVTSGGMSIIAQEVLRAEGTGVLLPHPPLGSCDIGGNATDASVPPSATSGTPFSRGGGGISFSKPGRSISAGGSGSGLAPASPTVREPDSKPPKTTGGPVPPAGGPPLPGPAGPAAGAEGDTALPKRGDSPDMAGLDPGCPGAVWKWKIKAWEPVDDIFKYGMRPKDEVFDQESRPSINDKGFLTKSPWESEATAENPSRSVYSYLLIWYDANLEKARSKTIYGYPGITMELISTECPGEAPEPAPRNYVVKAGDTLSGIAKKELGDESRWPEIPPLNPFIEDPDIIFPDTVLILPPS